MFRPRFAKRLVSFFAAFAFTLGLISCGGHSSPSPTPTPTPTPTTSDGKADALLAQMTQGEKLQMVQGGVTVPDGNFNYTVPRGAGG